MLYETAQRPAKETAKEPAKDLLHPSFIRPSLFFKLQKLENCRFFISCRICWAASVLIIRNLNSYTSSSDPHACVYLSELLFFILLVNRLLNHLYDPTFFIQHVNPCRSDSTQQHNENHNDVSIPQFCTHSHTHKTLRSFLCSSTFYKCPYSNKTLSL